LHYTLLEEAEANNQETREPQQLLIPILQFKAAVVYKPFTESPCAHSPLVLQFTLHSISDFRAQKTNKINNLFKVIAIIATVLSNYDMSNGCER